jgi:hypothetical protein
MKNIFAFLFGALIVSCTPNKIPKIDTDTPFVVGMIERYDDKHSIYYGNSDAGVNNSMYTTKPAIILASKIFNIGDTIKINICK